MRVLCHEILVYIRVGYTRIRRLTSRTTGYLESLLQSRQGDDDVNEGHRLDGA